ncbi:phage tail protein [Shewanella baltica]|uniref:phage tail protein n=1 Tax=Shewanella baltica TaxID=62322 RepID=UPI003D7ABB3D
MGIPALNQQPTINGAKAGEGEQRSPVESPDDLRSIAKAKILLAIGEGEFEGQLSGQNVFLDGTPLMDPNGAENFPGVIWDFRPGTAHQTYIPGLPSVENEVALGIELKSDQPYTRAITNSLLSAVRVRFRWPALQQQLDNGDVNGYRIAYAIDLSTDGGSYQTVLSTAVDGKTTQPYERSHRIDLPTGSGWQIRIRRLTPNQNNNRVADLMQIAAITDVIDRKLKYPNTALLYVEFDASQFQNIPVISCEPFMRKVKVPTNYNPLTRDYAGVWDGSFKIAWSDNPAWVSYDIILDDRFGTGRRINSALVDKWELYQIAQYCDQLVPDGKGGMEPRYICNIYIQQATEAWQVLRDLASIYRGMTYWSNGQMYSVADMPRDVDFIYNNSNVIDGKFSYSSSSEKVKYTRALISWDNPDNAYESDVTSVSDQPLQRRYGDNVVDLSALGCTRESEAQRRGKWAIYTNNNDRAVNFKVGMDGSIPLPGFVIGIADQLIAGSRIGGRISAVNGKQITLDRATTIAVNDRLIINLPSGKAQARTIEAVNGRVVTVTTEYSETPLPQLLWSVESDELKLQQFRVLRVAKANSYSIEYEITAVEHNPSKYPYIDTGARLEERPISKLPIGAQEAPATVTISQSVFTEQTLSVTTITIQWATAKNAVAYEVEWRKDSGEWIKLPKTSSTSVDIRGVYTGQYIARVRAINSVDVSSVPKSSELTNITGKTGLPPAVASFTATPLVFGIGLNWLFPAGAEDTLRTELEYGPNNNDSGMIKLGDFAYPLNSHTMTGLSAGANFWFRARLVDRTGNVGPWSGFVSGQSSTDQTKYDEYFSERITSSALGQELLGEIELIPLIKIETDKIPDIEINLIDTQNQIQQMQAEIADISGAPDWDNTASYLTGQLVKYQGKLYSAKQTVPAGTLPTNTTYWTKIGEYSSLGEAVSALTVRVDTVETSIETIDGKLTAESSRIDGIFSQVNPPLAGDFGWNAGTTVVFAGVWSEQYARASADEALAKSIETVAVSIDKNTAAIITEQMARATADESLANQIISISATVNGNAALIKLEQTARSDADEALAQNIVTVQASATAANSAASTAQSAANSAAQAAADAAGLAGTKGKVLIQSTAPAAADRLAQNLWIDTTGNANTPKRWNGSTWVAVTDKAATDAASAAAAAQDAANAAQQGVTQNAAAIQTEQTARANADSALATQITTVQASATAANTAASTAQSAANSAAQAAADAAGLAGTKGKVLIQSTAPAAADRLAQNLWIDTTGNANTPKRWNGSTWVAVTDKAATDAASAAAAAQAAANAAQQGVTQNAAAIQTEQTARANADSALATQITTVQASATAANTAASNAQIAANSAAQAAADAAGLAGTKGKVLIQSTAPAVADRLAQNLWIDTTGNANTPKRWSGSAWVAVTDKAATDAASAAAAAQAAANAAQQGVTQNAAAIQTEQTARANADSALATQITTVQASATAANTAASNAQIAANSAAQAAADAAGLAGTKGKVLIQSTAPAAADRLAQNLWIDTTGNANTPKRWNGSTWVAVTDKAATDAASAAAAAQAAANAAQQGVTQNAAAIQTEQTARANADSALATQITTVQASATAANNAASTAQTAANSAAQAAADAAGLAGTKGKVLIQSTAPAAADRLAQNLWIDTTGNANTPKRWNGSTWVAVTDKAATDAASAAAAAQAAANAAQQGVTQNAAAIQTEQTTRANADSALATQINTVQSSATAANTAASNAQTAANSAAQAAADAAGLAGTKGKVLIQSTAPAAADRLAQNLWIDTTGNANTPKRWNGSTWVAVTDKAATDAASAAAAAQAAANAAQQGVTQNAAAIQTEQTARANADSALATQITTVQSTAASNTAAVQQTATALASLNGDLQSMWKVSLGVTQDGKYYAAGFGVSIENSNEGLQSNFYVLADRFAILNKATGTTEITNPFVVENGQVFINSAFIGELQNKILIQREGGFMSVYGPGFGANNEFIDWYGPDVGNISNCTRANAITYRTKNGDAYFGGELSAGVLKTGVTNPDKNVYLINSYPVIIGPFSTNGKAKSVVVSFGLDANSIRPTSPSGNITQPSFSWQLQRKIGSGNWTTVASGTFSGTATSHYDSESSQYYIDEYCSGSSTYTDNSNVIDDYSYQVKVISYTRYHVTANVTTQLLTLISTEQ